MKKKHMRDAFEGIANIFNVMMLGSVAMGGMKAMAEFTKGFGKK